MYTTILRVLRNITANQIKIKFIAHYFDISLITLLNINLHFKIKTDKLNKRY